jgi:cell division septum initiation protein DivIVA
VERTLQQTLMNAQETVQLSRDNSKREADLLLREAELQAEKITEDARKRLASLKNELLVVRAQKDSFARRLRHLLESQLELIGVLELDDLGFGETDHRDNASPAKEAPAKPMAPPARPPVQDVHRVPTGVTAVSRNNTNVRRTDIAPPAGPARTGGAPIPNREPLKEKTGDAREGKKEPKISDHFIT